VWTGGRLLSLCYALTSIRLWDFPPNFLYPPPYHTHTHNNHQHTQTHTHTPARTRVGGKLLASELDFSLTSHTLSSLFPPPLPPPLPPAPPLLRSISLCSFPYTIC